ncbi:MAG: hypothetical protein AAB416_04955 [Patescibacteria group bacterium]
MDIPFLKKILDFTASTGMSSTLLHEGRTLIIADLDAVLPLVERGMSQNRLTNVEPGEAINRKIDDALERAASQSASIDTDFGRATLEGTALKSTGLY